MIKRVKFVIYLLIFIISTLLFYKTCNVNTYFGRYLIWRASDIKDFEKFPNYKFKASKKPFFFFKKINNKLNSLSVYQNKKTKIPLSELLLKSGTTAFLIIKNDTLVYEKYLNGYSRNSINTSFSVAKSITSLVTGICLDESFIKSINDPVVMYLPNLLKKDTLYKNLLISHVLDMQSGIQFKDHDLPWGDKPKAYYYPKLREKIISLPLINKPGKNFKYNSYNPILIGMIIEKVTKQSPADYFEKKLWNELGMEYSGSWSMDSKESGMTKMESGLNIRAIDFAKIGRLVLHNGNWNGKQLISEAWMNYSFSISEHYKLTEFANDLYYRNFWWIFANKNNLGYKINCIAGTGHLGQYLFIFPTEKIIIVRMGKHDKNVESWKSIFQEIVHIVKSNNKVV